MSLKLSNFLYKLLVGILITSIGGSIGGALSLLIYSFVYSSWESKQSLLVYMYEAEKTPFVYKGYILDRNRIIYFVTVKNVGTDLVNPIPIEMRFRDMDAKVVTFNPFKLTHKNKERNMPPAILITPEASHPYIAQDSLLHDPMQILFKLPHVWQKLDEMREEGKSPKDMIKVLLTEYDKEIMNLYESAYFEKLPVEACEIETFVDPMEHGDIGEFVLEVAVQNIDAFHDKPPFLRIVSKSPTVDVIEIRYNFLDRLVGYFYLYEKFIFILLLVSIGFNLLLVLKLTRLRRKVMKTHVKRVAK